MINTVFSESFFPFPVLIFHFRQPKTISTQRGRVYVGVGFRGKLLPRKRNDHPTKFDWTSLANLYVEYVQKNV